MALSSRVAMFSPLRSRLLIQSTTLKRMTFQTSPFVHRSGQAFTRSLFTNNSTMTPFAWRNSGMGANLLQQPLTKMFTTSNVGNGPLKQQDDKDKGSEKPVGKLREAWNKYGFVAIGTYGGVYVSTLGLLYGLLAADIVGAGGTIHLLKSLHVDSIVDINLINPKAGDLAVAWILTKFTEPIRLVLSLTITPTVARALNPLIGNKSVAEDIESRKSNN